MTTISRLDFWRAVLGDTPARLCAFSGTRPAPESKELREVTERFFAWPANAANADAWLTAEDRRGREVYFCAHPLTADRRVKGNAGEMVALYVDGDGAQIPPDFPAPSIAVRSSPARDQFYWLLSRAVPAATAEALNHRLALALGADRSGWDLTQLLRPPFSHNHKYADAPEVTLVSFDGTRYDPDDLDRFLPPLPEPTPARPPLPPAAPAIADDAELIERAKGANDGGEFARLFAGELGSAAGASEADYRLAFRLAFWTCGDTARIARLMETSALRRDKWYSRRGAGTWLDYTIAQACADQTEYYQPQRDTATFTVPPTAAGSGDLSARLAELVRENAALRRENAEQAVALERCRAEHARKDARIAGLEAEVRALEACIAHPDQTVGGTLPDIAEALVASYRRGDTLVREGREHARCVNKQAARRRSPTTVGRAMKAIAAERPADIITRTETIETARFKGPVEITNVYVPPEHRQSRAAVMLYLMPPPPAKKRHGGDHRIAVPPEVAAQDAPVRRERREVARFFSLVDDRPLGTIEAPRPTVDFWTAAGAPLTAAEAEAFRVKAGAQPPPPPRYRPPQSRVQDARKVSIDPSVQDASGLPVVGGAAPPASPVQDASGPEPAPFVNQGCRISACGAPPTRGGYCDRHHPDAWRDALALRERAPTPLHPRQGRPKCMNRACGATMPEGDRALYCPTCRRDGWGSAPAAAGD